MSKDYQEELEKLYGEYIVEESGQKKREISVKIEKILSQKIENLKAKDYYIWGLTHYFMIEDSEGINIAIEKFEAAIKINSKYNMARLYLGHCYQDLKNYSNALINYESVNLEELKKDYPIWRSIKLIEQIGYCNFKLGNKIVGLNKFEQVIKYYEKLPSIDLAYPSEMIECLPQEHNLILRLKKTDNY